MKDLFPHLAEEGFTETSPATRAYNCIAWAAGCADDWWWPDEQATSNWPADVPRRVTLDAFCLVFASLGYVACADGNLEIGVEKIAIYCRDDKPTHAARQLGDGLWSSKLGKWIDLTHTLRGIEGDIYGRVAIFMKRPRQTH